MTEKSLASANQKGQYHDKLTIHAICHSSMSRNTISEILDFESSFKTTGKEPAEGSNEGSKGCENKDMELYRSDRNLFWDGKYFSKRMDQRWRNFKVSWDKHRIGFTVQSRPRRHAQILPLAKGIT
jgi:hypothetical protein